METTEVTMKIQGLEEKMDKRLATLEDQNKQIMVALQKKKKGTFFGLEDENEERGNWSGRFDFFLSCLGYAVGLGNVWRFPYLCYKNGGGAFFIPYVIMLVFVGMPIFFLELSLGQFTSCGPLTCWKYAPLFQGVGLGMMVVSGLVAIYYNMIIGWSIYYLFASMRSELPWEDCDHDWNTEWCLDRIKFVTNETECTNEGWWTYNNGTCYEVDTQAGRWIPRAIYDQTLASKKDIKRILPSDEYLNRRVLKSDFSDGLGDLGPMQWELVLCYLAAFVFVVLALSKSIKSSGKVVYFTATFPYVVLVILLIRGLLLDHYKEGIEFYIVPDTSKLLNAQIWKDAAVQIFFSLSASWGGLIALASYNRFHNDCLRDAIAVSLGNCLTSVFAGFVIFSYLGELSHIINVPVDQVAESGPTLAFVVYPYALTKLPVSPLWAILFFLMLITLGVDSQFVLVETVITSIMDRFPRCREYKLLTVMCTCAVFFLLGLTLTTQGGVYMLEVMDTYSGGWNILFIALCETISICYIYGIKRFLQDIETMLGKKICGFAPFFICKWWWAANWMFFTPLLVAAVMVYSWVDYTDMDGPKYPDWADALGWLMTLCVIVCILGGAVYAICSAEGSFGEKLRRCTSPTVEWGPALIKHRVEVAQYVPNLVVDPWGKEQQTGGLPPNDIPFHMSEIKTGPPPSYNGNTNQAYDARL